MKAYVALALCSATQTRSGAPAASAATDRAATPMAATAAGPSSAIRADRAIGKGHATPLSSNAETTTKDPYATPLFRLARPLR